MVSRARDVHLLFRSVNERIAALTEPFARGVASDEPWAFVCECADARCVTDVRLTMHQLDEVRRVRDAVVVATGHEPRGAIPLFKYDGVAVVRVPPQTKERRTSLGVCA